MTKQERAKLTAMLDQMEHPEERIFSPDAPLEPFDLAFSDSAPSFEYTQGTRAVVRSIRAEFGL